MNPDESGGSATPARFVASDTWRGGRESIFVGLAGTLLLHAALILLAPVGLWTIESAPEPTAEDYLEVYLEEPEAPEEFILTNPEVASNPPDDTRMFSDRSQQAAQEEETETGDPSVPDVEGEVSESTQNIVRSEDLPASSMEEWMDARTGSEAETVFEEPLEERPIPGFDPVEDGEGLDVPVTPESERELEESPVFGVDIGEGEIEENMPLPETELAEVGQEEPVMPRPRPKLPLVSTGPTGTRRGAAENVGTIAVDANFSEYGDYLARMLEVIVEQWHILAWETLPSGEVGTIVSVSFRVDASGRIHGLEVLRSTASLTATLICQDAVSSRQPYGEWTADMKEVLGEEQTIQIRFRYQ